VRKIISAFGISIDAYMAPAGWHIRLFVYALNFSMAESFASIDTGIMGRKTYEVAKGPVENSSSLVFSIQDIWPYVPQS
jgi:dihydrofolate reductase